jgi:heme/copper-type cytochrome/quinol oxidase subunit 2
MMTPHSLLLFWWTISISWSALFLVLVSLYLYWDRRKRHPQGSQVPSRFSSDFVFVWVLIGLLALYIVSIYRSSSTVFVAGNVVVEFALILYAIRNRR